MDHHSHLTDYHDLSQQRRDGERTFRHIIGILRIVGASGATMGGGHHVQQLAIIQICGITQTRHMIVLQGLRFVTKPANHVADTDRTRDA